jgi:aspartate/methionine/tyrosine aminotransferase
MLAPGDEILVENPGYEPLLRCAEGLGATVRRFERTEKDGFRVDPERVAAAMTPRTRAIVVTNLHNPSGVRLPDDIVTELAAIADARGAYVIVDEVYAPFVDLPEDGVFRRSARKLAPNVVAIGSLTKCYGLGKQRIGWVLGPKEISDAAISASIATVGHAPIPYAAYAIAGLADVGKLAARAKRLLADKRDIADAWARSKGAARWSAPTEGLFGLVTLPGRRDLRSAIERLANEKGVLVAAGSFFGAPESFRLSWASCDEAKLREGLALLDALVE